MCKSDGISSQRLCWLLATLVLTLPMAIAPLPGGGSGQAAEREALSGWRVGFAEADITPAAGEAVMLAGFGTPRVVTGVESPLRAQAVAIEDERGRRVLLFAADVLGFGRTTVDAVRFKLHERHGIPPEAVCFSASHTH